MSVDKRVFAPGGGIDFHTEQAKLEEEEKFNYNIIFTGSWKKEGGGGGIREYGLWEFRLFSPDWVLRPLFRGEPEMELTDPKNIVTLLATSEKPIHFCERECTFIRHSSYVTAYQEDGTKVPLSKKVEADGTITVRPSEDYYTYYLLNMSTLRGKKETNLTDFPELQYNPHIVRMDHNENITAHIIPELPKGEEEIVYYFNSEEYITRKWNYYHGRGKRPYNILRGDAGSSISGFFSALHSVFAAQPSYLHLCLFPDSIPYFMALNIDYTRLYVVYRGNPEQSYSFDTSFLKSKYMKPPHTMVNGSLVGIIPGDESATLYWLTPNLKEKTVQVRTYDLGDVGTVNGFDDIIIPPGSTRYVVYLHPSSNFRELKYMLEKPITIIDLQTEKMYTTRGIKEFNDHLKEKEIHWNNFQIVQAPLTNLLKYASPLRELPILDDLQRVILEYLH